MSLHPDIFSYLDKFGHTKRLDQITSWPRRIGKKNWIVLRHDIDHDLDLALELAHHEHERGIQATYFLLHTAAYWHDPDLSAKCRQLHAYGHEIGLHLDLVSEISDGLAIDPHIRITQLLNKLRGAGVRIRGVAAHGAKACYTHGCTNFWFWKELKPSDPMRSEHGRSAEGVRIDDPDWQIPYPHDHRVNIGGTVLDLWTVSLKNLGLRYEASSVHTDHYWTDTGGGWTRSPDPMDNDLSKGRHIILMHPIWWRGPKKVHFVMCTDPQLRSRVGACVEATTPASVLDEWTMTQNRIGTIVEPAETPHNLSPTLVRNAIAHHTKLIDADVIELSSLMTSCEISDQIKSESPIFLWNIRSPLTKVQDSASDLLREHPTLYQNPEDPPLLSVDVTRWAWMSQHQRAIAHVKASRKTTGTDSTIFGTDTAALSINLADRLGLVFHRLLAKEWEQSIDLPSVAYPPTPIRDRSLWASARPLICLRGKRLGESVQQRGICVESRRHSTIQWGATTGSAPQAFIEFDFHLDPDEYILGQLMVIGCEGDGDGVRAFFHAWESAVGLRATADLGKLTVGTEPYIFRFAFVPPPGSDSYAFSLLAPKDSTNGLVTLDALKIGAAQVSDYQF